MSQHGQFRYSVWDPPLIVSQILTIQGLFYTSLGILIYVSDCLTGHSPSLGHIFSYQVRIYNKSIFTH